MQSAADGVPHRGHQQDGVPEQHRGPAGGQDARVPGDRLQCGDYPAAEGEVADHRSSERQLVTRGGTHGDPHQALAGGGCPPRPAEGEVAQAGGDPGHGVDQHPAWMPHHRTGEHGWVTTEGKGRTDYTVQQHIDHRHKRRQHKRVQHKGEQAAGNSGREGRDRALGPRSLGPGHGPTLRVE